jgi:AbrB family looped-hinge helix DNA binding protein
MVRAPGQRYYGSTVIGEKGQIVIPAEARKAFRLSAGDKVMVFGNESDGRMSIMRADAVAEYVSRGLSKFGELARVLSEETPTGDTHAAPEPSDSPGVAGEG